MQERHEPWLKRAANTAVSLGVVILIWWAVGALGLTNTALFPTPREVLEAGLELWRDGLVLSDLRTSLTRAAVGFCIGASLGVITGLLTARTRIFRLALNPFLTFLRPVPAIALVPVAIVWFGIGEPSKYFVIAYTVFLAVWLNTHHGIEHVGETYIRASRTLGATRFREFFEVVIPAAAPHIVAALRIGAALAFLSLVAAELTGASAGIGYRLQEARQFLRTDRMFVGLVELGALGALIDAGFVALGRRVIHWEQT